jgi:carboxypeptidase Q
MRRIPALMFCFIALFFAVFSFAQQPPATPAPNWSPEDLAAMNRLAQQAMKSHYALQQLEYLCDSIGPRPAGSAQHQAAAEYVASEMRKLGADTRLEPATVHHFVRGEERGELTTYPGQVSGTAQKIVLTALGHSVPTEADGITAEVVTVNTFDELTALGEAKVRGKIVLFNEIYDPRLSSAGYAFDAYGPAVAYRAGGPIAAAKLGAVAALVRSVGDADYRLPHTGSTYYKADTPKVPAAAVTSEDAGLIARLTARGPVKMHLVLTPQELPDTTGYNVVADIKGSEHPEQIVVVSGHLDSWDLGTGAIDDGAGVVVSMEALHLIKQLGLHPKRTVRFVAWVEEESGSGGATGYAKSHAGELGNTTAAIETDTGAGHPVGIFVAGPPELTTFLQPVANLLQPFGAGVLRTTDEGGADIAALVGVPGFAPIQESSTYFHYHHTPADTFDKVDPVSLRENSAVVAVLAYALANAQQQIPRIQKAP